MHLSVLAAAALRSVRGVRTGRQQLGRLGCKQHGRCRIEDLWGGWMGRQQGMQFELVAGDKMGRAALKYQLGVYLPLSSS